MRDICVPFGDIDLLLPDMSALIRSAILNHYSEISTSFGLEPNRMLRSAGLNVSCLRDPDMMIPAQAVARLLEASARDADEESFGLQIGLSRNLSNLGPISLLVRQEPTLGAALASLTRYMRIHNEAFHIWVEPQNELAVIREEIIIENSQPTRQLMELSVGALHRMLSELLGNRWQPKCVCFSHSAPKDVARYRRALGAPLEFGAAFDGVVCTAKDLASSISSSDPMMARYARQYLDSLMPERPSSHPERIRHLIVKLLPLGQCGAKQVSHYLGIDRRTLHRNLAEHDQTFSSLVHEVRREFAVRQLEDGRRSVEDIALWLGFSSRTSFLRWFKNAFGCTVSEWRMGRHA